MGTLTDRCRGRGKEEADTLFGQRGPVLALYEPSIASLPRQLEYPEPAELSPDGAKLRLFSYLAHTLAQVARQCPLLILLDDLQWADDLSLEFLSFVVRSNTFINEQIIIASTYRIDEVNTPLRNLVEMSDIETITLEPLEQSDIAAMMKDMLAWKVLPRAFSNHLTRFQKVIPILLPNIYILQLKKSYCIGTTRVNGRSLTLWMIRIQQSITRHCPYQSPCAIFSGNGSSNFLTWHAVSRNELQ